ncbi:MAG: immunoglobulin domain-containing protein [Verrucomicrobiota bacterium]
MNIRFSFVATILVGLAVLVPASASAQILISSGDYTQNFNALATSGTSNPWTDNSTVPGWYASRAAGGQVTIYRSDNGNAGALYSYGIAGVSNVTDRALGSTSSGTPVTIAFGVRFTNNTASILTNISITYTGEQWRNGGNASAQPLAFSYRVSSTPITDADAANASSWTSFPPLDFITPTVGATLGTLDGNAATNRQTFTNVQLFGVSIAPAQEIFLRWSDINDAGNDHGFGIDDFVVNFSGGVSNPPAAPTIITEPQSQTATVGDNVTISVAATGNPLPAYQWRFNNTNLPGATSATLSLTSVTTNQAGSYYVVITNSLGTTNSQTVTLTVVPPVPTVAGFTLMNYNTHGNFVGDWTTNSLQIQAIGRQVQYLNPDIITFQEIPMTNSGWSHMGEFVAVYRPGFFLATNSGTDGFIRSAIISRFPITRTRNWLDGTDLNPFGYTNANFTRDLFEAQITVPGFPQPLHVFTVHLKSGQGTDDSNRRSAEASAISNFITQVYFSTNSLHPYLLTGDMNEDIARPPSSNPQSIQKLISTPTGLRLTTPLNPYSGSELTHSIQAGLGKRYDYILPCELLYANIASSQVFRTDLLPNPPAPLLASDAVTASDHLPVFMTFNNPYDKPFRLLSFTRSNLTVTLKWESVLGQPYRVESSTNLTGWNTLASNLVATGTNYTFSTNLNDATRYFRIYRGP